MQSDINRELFPDVVEIQEFSEIKIVNKYLEEGWKLINIHNRAYEDSDFKDQFSVYCLGWTDKNKKPAHPFNGLHIQFDDDE